MWTYGDPYPPFKLAPLKQPEWVSYTVVADVFEGMNSQTGTYFETPGHFPSAGHNYMVEDVPFETLIDMPADVIHLRLPPPDPIRGYGKDRYRISGAEIAEALAGRAIPKGQALLIDTGWGPYWNAPFFLEGSPYFSYDAFMRLLALESRLMGSDLPRWENLDDLQNLFPEFYKRDILMVGPCVNLDKIRAGGLLTILPLHILKSCCIPCRAFIRHGES